MKHQTLFKRIPGLGLVFALVTGCSAPGTQAPTLMPLTSSTTVVVTLSPTPSAQPTMEKIWDTNGSPNTFYRPTELALNAQGDIYIIDSGNQRVQEN